MKNFQVRAPEELATAGKIGMTRGICPASDIIDVDQCDGAISVAIIYNGRNHI
jgi:hypothetical protein